MVRHAGAAGFSIGYGTLGTPEMTSCDRQDWTGKTICKATQFFEGERMYISDFKGGDAGESEYKLRIQTMMYEGADKMDAPIKDIWWPQI